MGQGLTFCTLFLVMFPSDRNVLVIIVESCESRESCGSKIRLGWGSIFVSVFSM